MDSRHPEEVEDRRPVDDVANDTENGKELHKVQSNVDVLEVTHERPYLEINFIGTYAAVCLGALSCYGGFVMPATSLALINEDIGELATASQFPEVLSDDCTKVLLRTLPGLY